MLGREGRQRREAKLIALEDGVTDLKVRCADDADHIAGKGLVERFALAPEGLGGVVEGDAAAGARVGHLHAALEPARADPDECVAVAMARIHVRLDLEDEAGEIDASSGRSPPSRSSRGEGGGESSMIESSSSLTPKLVSAEPKNTGVEMPVETPSGIEFVSGSVEQRQLLPGDLPGGCIGVEGLVDRHRSGLYRGAASGRALEGVETVGCRGRRFRAGRPGHRPARSARSASGPGSTRCDRAARAARSRDGRTC